MDLTDKIDTLEEKARLINVHSYLQSVFFRTTVFVKIF